MAGFPFEQARQGDISIKLLFDITDDDGQRWGGKRIGSEVWLVRYSRGAGQWVTVRVLEEQEVEEYQKIAGNYPRA